MLTADEQRQRSELVTRLRDAQQRLSLVVNEAQHFVDDVQLQLEAVPDCDLCLAWITDLPEVHDYATALAILPVT